jgi:hypothetical protein
MTILYVVRDSATKGVDFMMCGVDDFAAAITTLHGALDDGCDVELAAMPVDQMDEHTERLIDGEDDGEDDAI